MPRSLQSHVRRESYEGRDLWLAEPTNRNTAPASDKPAFRVDGNTHAGEVTGSMAALHLISTLLEEQTFRVLPRISPDAAHAPGGPPPRGHKRRRPHPPNARPLRQRRMEGVRKRLEAHGSAPAGRVRGRLSSETSRLSLFLRRFAYLAEGFEELFVVWIAVEGLYEVAGGAGHLGVVVNGEIHAHGRRLGLREIAEGEVVHPDEFGGPPRVSAPRARPYVYVVAFAYEGFEDLADFRSGRARADEGSLNVEDDVHFLAVSHYLSAFSLGCSMRCPAPHSSSAHRFWDGI
ncbi:MAG: hypothetical protein H0U65_10860 [Rubrobacter sp.]|nr:hypothetical protein [Rubrobacter sp.]